MRLAPASADAGLSDRDGEKKRVNERERVVNPHGAKRAAEVGDGAETARARVTSGMGRREGRVSPAAGGALEPRV